jgi:lipid-A-disaccharide synthase
MQAAGGQLIKHYRELAFMGVTEVLANLRTILNNMKFCKQDILQFKPDVVILIDYPGFNVRIAKWAKQQGIKTIYYISPKVWAWKESRVKTMKQCIDKMLVILPFEKDYYKNRWNWDVEYVGHPLIDAIDNWRRDQSHKTVASSSADNIVALLPGSRKHEILKKLPVMLEVTKFFPDNQFIVAKAPGIEESFYDELLKPCPNVSYVAGETYHLLNRSKAAIVTSGTATLETALFDVPEVVCYRLSSISYSIAKRFVKIKYISLVNLIMDKLIVKEFIQHEMTVENLKNELKELLTNEQRIAAIKKDYSELRELLSKDGHASVKAASSIIRFLTNEAI